MRPVYDGYVSHLPEKEAISGRRLTWRQKQKQKHFQEEGGKMYVYFIVAGQFVKIGKAENPSSRMKELQVGCPFKMRIYATINCTSTKCALVQEKQLHSQFQANRVCGEWFRWTKKMKKFIHNYKQQIEREHLLATQYQALMDAHYLAAMDRDK